MVANALALCSRLVSCSGAVCLGAGPLFVQLLGLERSKEVAVELVEEAKAAIAEFGDAAAPLNGLADYIIQRKN